MFTCPRRIEDGMDLDSSPLRMSGTNLDTWRESNTCSYCGSMSGEDFMNAVKDNADITPTDKNYKAYVTYKENRGKFYFQHLSNDQRIEFIKLLNDKKVNIGYPGYFYNLPFFITRDKATQNPA